MAFRYPLQTILKLRQSLERQEEQKLLAAAAVAARLRAEIERLEENYLEAQRAALSRLAIGGVAAELQFASACTAAYQEIRNERRKELRAAEAKRLEQMSIYRSARQKREILEGLRERQEAAYALESARREQQSADETFLIQRFHGRGDAILPSREAESAQRETAALEAREGP